MPVKTSIQRQCRQQASSRPVRHPLVVKFPTQSQQQQPVSGEQPHPECSKSSHGSPRSAPKHQAFEPLQAQHSELGQAQQAPNSQAEYDSSIAASKRQMLDSSLPGSAETGSCANHAQGCGAAVNPCTHDITRDMMNQVCCCFIYIALCSFSGDHKTNGCTQHVSVWAQRPMLAQQSLQTEQ